MKKDIDAKMLSMVLFRGTKNEIYSKLNGFNSRVAASMTFDFVQGLNKADFSFEACLGVIGGVYLDYEVFVLPTNKEGVFIITEVTVL